MENSVLKEEVMLHATLFSLTKIKREAKKLKPKYPGLSHGQLLNIASNNVLKVRNYYEATKLSDKHIKSLLTIDSGFAACSYCHFNFSTEVPNDIKAHEEIHFEYEKAEHTLGYLPAAHDAREKQKKLAYQNLHIDNPFAIKITGALTLIRAHFDRSLEASIHGGYWREHPIFEDYVAMVDDYSHLVPVDVMRQIRKNYGEKPGKIKTGSSYWYP